MKKLTLFLSCLLSVQSFALVCKSDKGEAILKIKKLKNGLVKAEVSEEKIISIYAGKKLSKDKYLIFNEEGSEHVLKIKKTAGLSASFNCHSRRHCPPTTIGLPKTYVKIKSDDGQNEYFNCL